MVKEYYQKVRELGIGKLLLILLAGILLVASYSGESSVQKDKEVEKTVFAESHTENGDEHEASIRDIILKMDGVIDADVLITYLDSGRKILVSAKSSENDSLNEQDGAGGIRTEIQSNESEEYLYIGDEPYVVMQTKPTVCGVVVVYKGTIDKTAEITEAVKVLTGTDYNRIKVSLMN